MGVLLPMRKLINQPRIRLAGLLTVLTGLLLLNLISPPLQNEENNSSTAQLPETTPRNQVDENLSNTRIGRPEWVPSGEDIFVDIALSTQMEIPLQPPEPTVPEPPTVTPEPAPPMLPYVAMAKFKSGEKSVLYLRTGNDTIPVSEGELIGGGDYKVEKISESGISIRYLPMNHLHELSLSGLE